MPDSVSLDVGQTRNVTLAVDPIFGDITGLSVVSSDSNIATVTTHPTDPYTFIIEGVGVGSGTITATLGSLTATCSFMIL